MVRRGHLGPGGVEASAASDLGGRANGGAGEHLDGQRSVGRLFGSFDEPIGFPGKRADAL